MQMGRIGTAVANQPVYMPRPWLGSVWEGLEVGDFVEVEIGFATSTVQRLNMKFKKAGSNKRFEAIANKQTLKYEVTRVS